MTDCKTNDTWTIIESFINQDLNIL